MSSAANQNPWAPYDTYKDCSQGICSMYCPQWCYIIFPPPPPFSLGGDSGTDFSPLIIAVLGILASAFILVSYYTIISKYCRRRGNDNTNIDFNENRDEVNNEGWQGTAGGLDEAVIKSIAVCKYNKGDGLVEGTDCSVCLSEFEEDESLRLLPKCNHAFHLPCIDTWLKSHSSCPLCRANISSINALSIQVPAPVQETPRDVNVSVHEYQHRNESVLVIQDLENSVHEEAVVSLVVSDDAPKTPIQGFRGMENSDNIIEITQDGIQPIRRSVSLNSSLCQGHVLIADILRSIEDDEDFQMQDIEKNSSGVLNLVRSPLAIKRSVSTGRFTFTRYGKGKNSIIPN